MSLANVPIQGKDVSLPDIPALIPSWLPLPLCTVCIKDYLTYLHPTSLSSSTPNHLIPYRTTKHRITQQNQEVTIMN